MIKATRGYIEGIATALSQGSNIKFEETQKGWFTDVKNKVLHYNPVDLVELPAFATKGMILHETGHLKHSEVLETSELGKKYPCMNDVYNVLEDIRIEHELIKEYGEYATEGLQANNAYHGQQHADRTIQDWQKLSKLRQYLFGLLAYANRENISGDALYNQCNQIFKKIDELPITKLYETMSEVNYYCKNRATSLKELQIYADTVLYPKIKELIEAEDNKNEKPMECQANPKEKKLHVTKDGEQKFARIPDTKDLDLLLAPYINTLSRKLGDILKEKQAVRFTGSHRSGKLLSKNAYKVLTDNPRAFSKKNNPSKPSYVVTFALDASGSMNGERRINTYMATHLIKRAVEKLKFKVNIIKFASRASLEDLDGYKNEFSSNGSGNNENLMLDCVIRNTDPKDDNLVFVLTDGGAAYDLTSQIKKLNSQNYTISAIAVGLSETSNSDYIKELRKNYPVVAVVPAVENLPIMMTNLLKKYIHR